MDRLQRAAAEGRIDLAELDDRLGKAFSSKTYGELDALLADLPAPLHQSWPLTTDALVLHTTAPNIKQTGLWVVPRRIIAESTTGFITIDFTKASCSFGDITVEATTRLGRIRLILPRTWAAQVDPSSSNTSHIINTAATTPSQGGTTVTVSAHPSSGYIKIKQRH